MSKSKNLIIGCGTAAMSALKKMRSVAAEDEIKLVTMEEYPPYSPAALPYLIAGRIKEEDMWLADEQYFKQMKCCLAKGKEVVRVLPEAKEVIYKDGEREKYDTLLIASGSEPSWPPIAGLEETTCLGFHTMTDYRKLAQQLKTKKEITVYGGGLVALELATALLENGHQVKIVVRSRLLRRHFDADIGILIEDLFRKHGVQIYKGCEINEVKKRKEQVEIALSNGSSFSTELLIIAVGVKPRVSFLEGVGIKVNKGILVDKKMRTNIPDVYAAGDIAESSDFFFEKSGINAISPSAISQGRIAGANMVGEEIQDSGWISMNVFKFFGHSAFSIGLAATETSQVFKEKDDKQGSYKDLVFQENRLVGARFLDINVDPGIIRYLIEEKVDMDGYKEMLFEKPLQVSRVLMLEAERK